MREFVVSVWDGRAAVCRLVQLGPDLVTYQAAENWEALEDEAIQAVYAAGGSINWSGLYPCPQDLAARATFVDMR